MPSSRYQLTRLVRGIGLAWLVLGLLLLVLIAVELLLRLGFLAKDRAFPLPNPDPRLVAEGYDNAPWVREIFAAQESLATEWHAYELYRPKPDADSPLGFDPQGFRLTLDARGGPAAIEGKPAIWVFGGSAAWGWGAKYNYTIPSQLAAYLVREHPGVRVRNFAQPGYVSTQDVLSLMMRLREGERPDVVVFYGGANDVLATLQEGRAGLPQHEANRRSEFNILRRPGDLVRSWLGAVVADSAFQRLASSAARRLMPARAPATRPFGLDQAKQLLGVYEANLRLAATLGRQHGFRVVACWQPLIFTKRVMAPYEAEKAAQYAWLRKPFAQVDQLLDAGRLQDLPVEFVSFRHALDDTSKLVFVDFCHTTESANATMAEALARVVNKVLASSLTGPGDLPP